MKVTLIALTQYVDYDEQDGSYFVVGQPSDVIEDAGRLCYGRHSAENAEEQARFIQARISQGHESVLEHASATFLIEGISRTCMAQLRTHRIASFSVRSQRYCNESDADCVVPPAIAEKPELAHIFNDWLEAAAATYDVLVAAGVKREDARFILPEATATKMMMTANFREWRHIIRLRCDKAAQWEIRGVCMEILRVLHRVAPACFGDLWGEYGRA